MWGDLTRWERAELGRAFRLLGWSYGEIRRVLPAPKGTLAGWCRDIRLTGEQAAAIRARNGSQLGVPRDTQWRRREEVERIQASARLEAADLASNPLWVAGTALYWGEGAKTGRRLELTNSDPALLRVFIRWVLAFHHPKAEFVLSLNLHADNDESAAKRFWQKHLGLDSPAFTRTFIKTPGTGHRKNHLAHGVCRVRTRRSTDGFIRTMVWIEELASLSDNGGLSDGGLSDGGGSSNSGELSNC